MPKYKILIIDYEPRSIRQLRDPLLEAGYEVEIAENGLDGIKAFNDIKPDLTLIEAMIPKKHGFEVCQELKKTPHGSTSPIVIVTSVYKGRKYRNEALHMHGCDEYLEKPVAPDRLTEVVVRLIGGRPATDSAGPVGSSAAPEPAPTAAPTVVKDLDAAESEIMERLDEILPDSAFGRASKPEKAQHTTAFEIGETTPPVQATRSPVPKSRPQDNLVPFVREVGRTLAEDPNPPSQSSIHAAPLGVHGNAQPVRFETPQPSEASTLPAETTPEPHRRPRTPPRPDLVLRAERKRGHGIGMWVVLGLIVIGALVALFLLRL